MQKILLFFFLFLNPAISEEIGMVFIKPKYKETNIILNNTTYKNLRCNIIEKLTIGNYTIIAKKDNCNLYIKDILIKKNYTDTVSIIFDNPRPDGFKFLISGLVLGTIGGIPLSVNNKKWTKIVFIPFIIGASICTAAGTLLQIIRSTWEENHQINPDCIVSGDFYTFALTFKF